MQPDSNRPDIDNWAVDLQPRSSGITATKGEMKWRGRTRELVTYLKHLESFDVIPVASVTCDDSCSWELFSLKEDDKEVFIDRLAKDLELNDVQAKRLGEKVSFLTVKIPHAL